MPELLPGLVVLAIKDNMPEWYRSIRRFTSRSRRVMLVMYAIRTR